MSTRACRTAVLVVGILSLFGNPGALVAQPRAPEQASARLRIEGTVEGRQRGVPACGIFAAAGWVDFQVSRVVEGAPPSVPRIRLMVQCPESLRSGRVYVVTAVSSRPRRGSWRMFSVFGRPPADGVPLYWALSARERR